MLTADNRTILSELALYTTFLTGALSPTAVPTFCELLFGGMLSEHGFVTQALLSVQFQCKWSSYHQLDRSWEMALEIIGLPPYSAGVYPGAKAIIG